VYIDCDLVKVYSKFELTIRGGIIAILIFDLMTLNICHVLRSALSFSPRSTYLFLTYIVSTV